MGGGGRHGGALVDVVICCAQWIDQIAQMPGARVLLFDI